jgi:hypothetical protein
MWRGAFQGMHAAVDVSLRNNHPNVGKSLALLQ